MSRQIQKNGDSRSLVFMIAISLLTQILTLMKSSIVAGVFGTSEVMDAYNFANSIVSFLFGIIASGIPTILIPSYVKQDDRKNTDGFITLIYALLFLVVVLVMALRYQIIGVFSNRNELFVNTACNVLLILLFSQYLMSITSITTAYFQCTGKYNIPKIINFTAQIAVVSCLIFIKNISIYQYASIIAGGILVNFVLDLFAGIRLGWRYKPNLNVNSEGVKVLLYKFFPILFSSSIYQLSLLIDSTIASRLETGKLTILSYSSQIVRMVNAILIGNLLVYAYPKIIKKINEENGQKVFWKQTVFFHLIVCLVISGFVTVGKEGISLLFLHGLFDSEAVKSVYYVTAIYILGQQMNIIRDLIYRYFYAIGDTKIAAKNSMIVSVVNVTTSILLVQKLGLYGVVLGTVISSIVSLILICIKFRQKIGYTVAMKKTFLRYALNFGMALATILIVMLTKTIFVINHNLAAVLVYGMETVFVFALIFLAFNRRREFEGIF